MFWYCKKDEVLTENESSLTTADYSTSPVTLDEVKQLYGNVKSGVASSREDIRETPLGAIPILELAHEDNGLVIAPIEKGLIYSNRLMGGFLKFYKDAQNQVRSNLFVFMAESLAYQDPIKAVAFKKLTGFVLVINDDNNMISYEERVNGVSSYRKRANIPFDDAFINSISGLNVASQRAGRKCPSAAGHGSTDTYTWWEKLRDKVKAVFSSPGKGGDDDTSGSAQNDNNPNTIIDLGGTGGTWITSTVPTNTGGGGSTSIVTDFCNDLDNTFMDDDEFLTNAESGGTDFPWSSLGGVPSKAKIESVEHRNRLRFLKDWFDCGTMYQLETLAGSKFADCAYYFIKANGTSSSATQQVRDILGQINSTTAPNDPALIRLINERGCELLSEGCWGDVEGCIKNMRIQDLKDKYPGYNYIINTLLSEGMSLDEIEKEVKKVKDEQGTPVTPQNVGGITISATNPLCSGSFVLYPARSTEPINLRTAGLNSMRLSLTIPPTGASQNFDIGPLFFTINTTKNPPGGLTHQMMMANAVNRALGLFQLEITSGMIPLPLDSNASWRFSRLVSQSLDFLYDQDYGSKQAVYAEKTTQGGVLANWPAGMGKGVTGIQNWYNMVFQNPTAVPVGGTGCP